MPAVRVGCALSDVNRADLPNGLGLPARLTEYVRRFQVRVANNSLFELQPEEFWTTPTAFPDEFAARESNQWWHS